jgi:hypothetical protein
MGLGVEDDFAVLEVHPLEGRRLAIACLIIDEEAIEERRVLGVVR